MDVDSQLEICTVWTVGDTSLVIITRWIIFFFPLIIFRWVSKLILLSARPHDRWACGKGATTNTAIGGSKNMLSLFGNSRVLDQLHQAAVLSAVLWQVIPDLTKISGKCFTDFSTTRICLWIKTQYRGKKIPNSLKVSAQNTTSVLIYPSDTKVGH